MKSGNEQNCGLPVWKRALDLAIMVLALPVIVPVAVILVLVIRLNSKGPVLFQQERVGYRGRPFMCLKFRTMHCGAETGSHQGHLQQLMQSNVPMTKMDVCGDRRIIRFGRWIRASGLDELPQLLNVLLGEMSVVGPRPCLPYEAAQYLPWQRERFEALPGLTGLWQVSGKNRTTFTEMMQYDIAYARTRNLWLDVKIIVLTPWALLVQLFDLRRLGQASSVPAPAAPVVAAQPMDQRV